MSIYITKTASISCPLGPFARESPFHPPGDHVAWWVKCRLGSASSGLGRRRRCGLATKSLKHAQHGRTDIRPLKTTRWPTCSYSKPFLTTILYMFSYSLYFLWFSLCILYKIPTVQFYVFCTPLLYYCTIVLYYYGTIIVLYYHHTIRVCTQAKVRLYNILPLNGTWRH